MRRSIVGLVLALGVAAASAACESSAVPGPEPAEVEGTSASLTCGPEGGRIARLLAPAPRPPAEYYDLFGTELNDTEAAFLVAASGLNPSDPNAYRHRGLVHVTPELVAAGKNIFATRKIGDDFGLQRVFGFAAGFSLVADDIVTAIASLGGKPTNNLVITLSKPLALGSKVLPAGSLVPTGLDVDIHGTPIGLTLVDPDVPDTTVVGITCALCHAQVDMTSGEAVLGPPNIDIGTALFIALAPNTAAGFARVALNPLDPKLQGPGSRTILDSQGRLVSLPDPTRFEEAIDDLVLTTPYGQFESSPDAINNTTQIPSLMSFANRPSGWDGAFGIGPFGGVAVISSAVHTSEVNLLAAAQQSGPTIGVDSEVYIAVALQNAVDPTARYTPSTSLEPSDFLAGLRAADPNRGELEDIVQQPQRKVYPRLKPSLFTYDGLIFSPDTGKANDPASGDFFYAANAMAAFQNALLPPPNLSADNAQAIASGSVRRGARVFLESGCASCHRGRTFTDDQIHPVAEIGTNSARARSHLAVAPLLVSPRIFPFDAPVTNGTVPAGTPTLRVPTFFYSPTPRSLPFGLEPDGGYKTPTLRGLYASAPYLHDGGCAMAPNAIVPGPTGWYVPAAVVNGTPVGFGLPFTLVRALPPDPANSLRALLDRTLRAQVVEVNHAYNEGSLLALNLEGIGHDFYVDEQSGACPQEQTDLIHFLLALDDDPLR